MMKKLFAFMMSLLLMITLSACKAKEEATPSGGDDEPAAETDTDKADSETSAGSITLQINTEGNGQIAYEYQGGRIDFNNDQPYQSAIVNFESPSEIKIAAKADAGWKFVKWTLNGDDYAQSEEIFVFVTESAEYKAVFTAE